MAQFGGVKNPPWVRDAAGMTQPGAVAVGNLQQAHVGALQNPVLSQPGVVTNTIYCLGTAQAGIATPQQYTSQYTSQQLGVAMQQAALQQTLPQPGIAIPTSLAATQVAVSYPTPRVAQQQQSVAAAAHQPKQRVFTGTVTKLHDNFGFVDEDVFFQMSCVKGHLPKVMDRVLMSVTPSQTGQFGQPPLPSLPGGYVLKAQQQMVSQNMGGGSLVGGGGGMGGGVQPPPLMAQHAQTASNLMQQSNIGRGIVTAKRPDVSSYRGDRSRDRDRHTHERRESRRSPVKRSWSPRRSRSPASRTKSPSRRSRRVIPRYVVQIPKLSLDTLDASVITLKSRYTNLYVPSDFFDASFNWVDVFPLHRPLTLGHQCSFHIRNKDVEPLEKSHDSTLEPTDADHLYSAKVMLMSTPSMDELYRKSCGLAEDNVSSSSSDSRSGDLQHPTRLIQFLVGLKGKSEPMAIGGPWSPSVDGPNPAEDPHVLIKTAIRTTKALTGIDLSHCTHWYRFVEIHYRRPEETHKGRVVPARVETVEDEEDGDGSSDVEEKKDPTHYSEMDPKTMKDEERKKQEERERAAVEKKYTLPENPTIVVQPSTTAKSGKFDCTVSLFAELFNEMLMRDFAFCIYKALVAAPDRREDDKKDHGKNKEVKDSEERRSTARTRSHILSQEPQSKKQKTDEKKEQKEDKKKSDRKEDKKNKDDKVKDRDDRDQDQDEDVSDQDNDSDKDKDKKKHDKKREKVKYYTANPALLMAFVYFDLSRTNYLMDKDVEEIIHTVGLRLSRSQKMAHELTELKRRLHEQQKSSEALQANSKCYYDLLSKSKASLSSLVSDMTTALEEKPIKIVKQELNGEK
ncbi:hypothetical protein NP493_266g03046 [Ridgeia piscesae]|uniref:DBC1/CARP1 catalytically inactive NUDIX hydrolase domain-containing protein n=1 Tax=Ridgeia piscesae TaxID=27915 RepID=A0AAD9NXV2_RIDPI|nr:hypothetical protein NP493_266g03046 [Ridgeia piscesae]